MTNGIGVNERVSLVMSLRKKGIGNIDVLRAMELVPREVFVDRSVQGPGLLRHCAADRLWSDHFAALCCCLHDRKNVC